MGNRIVTEPSRQIRKIARDALSGQWMKVFEATFIFYLLTTVVSQVLDLFFTYRNPEFTSDTVTFYGYSISSDIPFGGSIYQFFLMGAFQLGMAYFLLTFLRTRRVEKGLIFEGFSNYLKVFWMTILIAIKTILWALLFIIPGIIAVFRYSMSYMVLADHPDWKASQCIRESTRLMTGNKWKLFCLELSFIGWAILAALASSIFTEFSDGMNQYAVLIIGVVLAIPEVFLTCYVNVAEAAFYDIAAGRLVVINAEPDANGFQGNVNGTTDYTASEAMYAEKSEPADSADSTDPLDSYIDVQYTEVKDEMPVEDSFTVTEESDEPKPEE